MKYASITTRGTASGRKHNAATAPTPARVAVEITQSAGAQRLRATPVHALQDQSEQPQAITLSLNSTPVATESEPTKLSPISHLPHALSI